MRVWFAYKRWLILSLASLASAVLVNVTEAQVQSPYELILSCGLSNTDHINIRACLIGDYDINTDIELVSEGRKQIFKVHNLHESGGFEDDRGFHIDLSRHFSLRIQNASDTLILGATIIDKESGKIMYSDRASTYQLISVGN